MELENLKVKVCQFCDEYKKLSIVKCENCSDYCNFKPIENKQPQSLTKKIEIYTDVTGEEIEIHYNYTHQSIDIFSNKEHDLTLPFDKIEKVKELIKLINQL
jgi:hypothetical protein